MRTNRRVNSNGKAPRKRAVVAVQVTVLLVVLIGFAALTVDVGAMYNARADLQRSADAASLAAAAMLSNYEDGSPLELARAAALDYTERNAVLGRTLTLDVESDVEFGRMTYTSANGYTFTPTTVLPDAVRVQVRHTSNSVNGSMPLYFARIFGVQSTDLAAEALAMMTPRDIAIVADLSASHNDDSELAAFETGDVNLLDVWANVPVERGVNGVGDGVNPPPPGDPFNPAPAPTSGPGGPGDGGDDPGTLETGGQAGPTFGRMYWWGDSLSSSYEPATDPGVIHLPRYQTWNDSALEDMLEDIGYSASEVNALLSSSYDGSRDSWGQYGWTTRVAVALGLARWDSGIPGGLWQDIGAGAGNGNAWVAASELTWLVDWPFESGSWTDYIYNYVRKSNTLMAQADSDFQYAFGLKTLFNYALERKPAHDQTPDIADTPHQPMQAVKDAVNVMTAFIDDLDTNDQLSLEIYGTVARHEVDLTQNYQEVSDRLNTMQAGHYDSWTNMGGGIARAIEELTSSRARDTSSKMIVLLTDGNANVTESGSVGDEAGGAAYALAQAQAAAAAGLRIFAVSVGYSSNQSLMEQIAEIGEGEHFHAEGSISEYSAQLRSIFQRLGGTRPVQLIR